MLPLKTLKKLLNNKLTKQKIFLIIVLMQILLISYLAFFQARHSLDPQSKSSLTPISRGDIEINNQDSQLKYFYEPKPGIQYQPRSNGLPTELVYDINQDTLHERFNYSPTKPDSTYRMVTLGDSFVFGLGVGTQENFSEVLEVTLNSLTCSNYPNFEVINLGFPGYDVQYAVERFKRRGQSYSPDLVIWLLKTNDFAFINEILAPRRDYFQQTMSEEEKQTYYKKGNYFPWTLKAIEEFKRNFPNNRLAEVGFNYMKLLNDFYQKDLLIFTFKDDLQDQYRTIINKFKGERPRTYFLDGLTGEVMDLSSRLSDGHPNPKGHRLIASALQNYLLNNLLSCK